jgi:uncharacterized delta-60 repeat protein
MNRLASPTIQSLESRTLLATGAIDPSYHPQFDDASGHTRYQTVYVQLDNKSLHFAQFSGKPTIWRQNPNGSLDKSFGSKGKITLPSTASQITTAPDGKIIVSYGPPPLGSSQTLHLARYDINGHLDQSFGGDGDVRLDSIKPFVGLTAIAAARDGKIIIATIYANNAYLYRVNNNGKLNRSFGDNGIASVTPPVQPSQFRVRYIADLAIRPSDQRIIAAGQDFDGWAFWTFSPAGVVESKQALNVPIYNIDSGIIFSVNIDADGSIVAGGRVTEAVGARDTLEHAIVARYPAPNSGEPFRFADLGAFTAGDTALQSDGKVIVSGGNKVFRLNRDMTLDQTFGSGGQADVGFGITDLAIQGDGKILVDGGSNSITGVYTRVREARLTGDAPSAAVSRKTLLVSGSAGADDILIGSAKGMITVTVNGTDPFLFSRSTVRRIHIDAGDGNDTIHLAKSAPSAVIKGGDGEDTLFGRRKKDKLTSIERRE